MHNHHSSVPTIFAVCFFALTSIFLPMQSLAMNGVMIGKPAPAFTLTDLSGKPVSLSAYRGKPVILEFWATWCKDCRETLPHLDKLYRTYAKKGLVVLAVSVDTKEKKVRPFLAENGYILPVLLDDGSMRIRYGIQRIPTLLLIDRTGVIRSAYIEYGEESASRIEADMKKLLVK